MKKIIIFLLFISLSSFGAEKLVSSNSELKEAIKMAKPGDIIIMANGVWKNTEILFSAKGTKSQPITLKAQEKGKVTLEESSNLRISGEYLIVKGLVFKNGFSPTSEVISFRKDSKTLANNSRLTEVVIDNFNGPERYDVQAWTILYGKNNRVDHCSFINKRTQGVTLIVRLNTAESVENNHQIDHNYFGPRQNLGSNGGETLRIGTSHFSMMNSKSIVEYNYFDRCDGEHEIISNKSGQNTYRFNTFFECKGTLTMRHGNETHVEGNVFFGNGVSNTGGIRVINEKQTVINNYCEGLTGNRFRGALTVMNGVPNSPLNRYVSVKESKIEGNSLINCDHIELCAGSDSERSAIPQTTSLSRNLFVSNSPKMFGIFDDISGLSFDKNIISGAIESPSKKGFTSKDIKLIRNEKGLLIPQGKELGAGAQIANFANRENTGVTWYTSLTVDTPFDSGNKIEVNSGLNTLYEAINNSKPGDILILTDGTYSTSKSIEIPHTLSIISNNKAKLLFETKALFTIVNGGSLKIKGLHIDGEEAPDGPLNSVITTSKYSMNKNYKLFIEDCDFINLDVNNYFNVLRVAPSTFADTVSIKNSTFENISGAVLALNRESDDIGIYNAETVLIENCSFKNIEGAALDLYRGGTDESTTAGFLNVAHCYFENVGLSKKNKKGTSVSLLGVQNANIENSIFKATAPLDFILTVGEPINIIHHCQIEDSQILNIEGEGFENHNNSSEIKIGDDNKPVGLLK
ncbi:chondroitinase-B domain-containing protein [Arcticibacterium luteifluviistationis]|uniref:Alginate lyase n=1 Tax=Arcticibacterium luteifluviistationis TaxID=1784714 RepID=A0A2Z4GBU3_9BACT|nr:chondroitinase-B domain-containing protein [Arcticibacterium luteifluviistationis]AWV98393.1 alginate lyase [Arcticibacterium luteifluviistationis]